MEDQTLSTTGNRSSLSPDTRGFTLLEIVVTIMLCFLVSSAAYYFFRSQNSATINLTNRIVASGDGKQFLDLRKRAISSATGAPTPLGLTNPYSAPANQVFNGLSIPRTRANGDGTTTNFTETYQTACAIAPPGIKSIDNNIFTCRTCPAGQLPVINDATSRRVYPIGTASRISAVSAALCVQQANGITTLRLLSLLKKDDGNTSLITDEVAVASPVGASRFQLLK